MTYVEGNNVGNIHLHKQFTAIELKKQMNLQMDSNNTRLHYECTVHYLNA